MLPLIFIPICYFKIDKTFVDSYTNKGEEKDINKKYEDNDMTITYSGAYRISLLDTFYFSMPIIIMDEKFYKLKNYFGYDMLVGQIKDFREKYWMCLSDEFLNKEKEIEKKKEV